MRTRWASGRMPLRNTSPNMLLRLRALFLTHESFFTHFVLWRITSIGLSLRLLSDDKSRCMFRSAWLSRGIPRPSSLERHGRFTRAAVWPQTSVPIAVGLVLVRDALHGTRRCIRNAQSSHEALKGPSSSSCGLCGRSPTARLFLLTVEEGGCEGRNRHVRYRSRAVSTVRLYRIYIILMHSNVCRGNHWKLQRLRTERGF